MKFFTTAAAALLVSAVAAQAATLDFVEEADENERGVENGTVISFGDIDVEFNAENGFAYFDDVSGGPGGLGVCGTINDAKQCDPSSDDNITIDEAVTLSFGSSYNLSGLSFNDADHKSLNENFFDTLLIAVNGDDAVRYTFGDAVVAVFEGVNSIMFGYDDLEKTANEFYVSAVDATPVPLPAAGWLLLAGLGGLGVMNRRKKA